MIDSNLPGEGTADDDALSFDDGVDAIANSIDPETDLGEDDGHEADADEESTEEGETDSDDDESDAEASAEEEDPEDGGQDGSDASSGGRFVSGDAKFRLEDGTVISVADLARNNLYQRDYTRKTQEMAEERKSFEAERQQVSEYSRSLAQQRDFLFQAAQQFLPKQPDRNLIHTDIIGYQEQMADYQEKMGLLNQLQQHMQADQARVTQEQEQERRKHIQTEAERLVQVMPELKDPATYNRFWSDTLATMADYGFTDEELSIGATDHRFFKVFRDLMKYRKARQAAPKVRKDVQSRPVMKPGKRMDPKAKISREQAAKSEALRKTGTFDAGVAALMDFDL